ncbi:ABC transporter ATP-binding protein [Candidatus Uabimicrobium sp. HlEnr_7]|uniref:ABC transporter ATP-binding protein n=1 Tax=Candidatus Uabimicrobium helgolandensis TaxID=3095367 RepID=UPI0035560630
MIKIEGLSKHYGNKVGLKKLDLTIKSGEIFAFLGPNGAGKTTTIKMMVGLLRPTTGTITICDKDIIKETIAAKKYLAYVPDQPYLYDKLTGREFLEFVALMYKIPLQVATEKIEKLTALFSSYEYVDRLTENYSHGMKQRIVFSAALIHDPQVLVVDEPMVGLDPKSAAIVKNVFKDQAAKGTTVFVSTHSLDVAEQIADRIAIIKHGEIIALGTLEELRKRVQKEARLEDIFLELTEEEQPN